jgi:hypothetical protein
MMHPHIRSGPFLSIGLLCAALVAACGPAPAPSAEQILPLVQTSVALTVSAQNNVATSVSLTLTAVAPLSAATQTAIPVFVPTGSAAAPVLATVTPYVFQPASGGAPQKPLWSCDILQKPFDETAYKPGDPFDIKWVITNTGSKTWAAGKDFKYSGGTHLTSATFVQLPEMRPNAKFSVSFDANAPVDKGRYVMTWIVEGGLCSTSVVIVSGRPGIDP